MAIIRQCLLLFAMAASISAAEPEAELRAAIRELADRRFGWETTTRQRFSGDISNPKVNLNAPVALRGAFDPAGITIITLLAGPDAIASPVTAVFRMGDAVGRTPLGWLRRTEIREAPGPDRTVQFDGNSVRLSRAFKAALHAMGQQTPLDEMLDLMADIKAYRAANGLVIGELRDAAIEKLWGEPRARSAPEIQGAVIFKLGGPGIAEYHLLLAIGFPDRKTRQVSWSAMQWSTRIREIDATAVRPPSEALKKLDE